MLIVACVFAALLWARSYAIADWCWYRTDATSETRSVAIASCRGSITFSLSRSAFSHVDPAPDAGFAHDRVDATDLLIDAVPPGMRLVAGFGAMTTAPQDDVEPITWRFLALPWWSVTMLALGALVAPKAANHVRTLTHRTYASMSNFLSSPLAFMKRTSPKIGRAGPQGRSCSPNSQATLA